MVVFSCFLSYTIRTLAWKQRNLKGHLMFCHFAKENYSWKSKYSYVHIRNSFPKQASEIYWLVSHIWLTPTHSSGVLILSNKCILQNLGLKYTRAFTKPFLRVKWYMWTQHFSKWYFKTCFIWILFFLQFSCLTISILSVVGCVCFSIMLWKLW